MPATLSPGLTSRFPLTKLMSSCARKAEPQSLPVDDPNHCHQKAGDGPSGPKADRGAAAESARGMAVKTGWMGE